MAEIIEGTYKLQFQHGSFHDFETGLTINRADEVEITEPMGRATEMAIASGRLLFVHVTKPVKKVEAKKNADDPNK